MLVSPEERAANRRTRFDNDLEPGRSMDPVKRWIGDSGSASKVDEADIEGRVLLGIRTERRLGNGANVLE